MLGVYVKRLGESIWAAFSCSAVSAHRYGVISALIVLCGSMLCKKFLYQQHPLIELDLWRQPMPFLFRRWLNQIRK